MSEKHVYKCLSCGKPVADISVDFCDDCLMRQWRQTLIPAVPHPAPTAEENPMVGNCEHELNDPFTEHPYCLKCGYRW